MFVANDPFGVVDQRVPVPGLGVRFAGWTIDPDTSAPINAQAYVGAANAVKAANVSRSDVGNSYPDYGPSHGFNNLYVFQWPGTHNTCVYGLNAAGTPGSSTELGCQQVFISGNPFGNYELATRQGTNATVKGWSIDPDTTAPIAIHVYVNGNWGGMGTASQSRQDVGAAYPHYGNGHGFQFSVPIGSGLASVCAYAINASGTGTNPLLGCRWVAP